MGIFDTPQWDVDASGEMLNRKILEYDARKSSKNRGKSKRKEILSKSNRVFSHDAQKQFETLNVSLGNREDKLTFSFSEGVLKRSESTKGDVGTEQLNVKQLKKRKKVHKIDGSGNIYVKLSGLNENEASANKLQLQKNLMQRSKNRSLSDQHSYIPDTNSNVSKNIVKQNHQYLQNNPPSSHVNDGKISQETNGLKSSKRLRADSTKAKNYGVLAKKQMTKNQTICDLGGEVRKRKTKRKLKGNTIEPFPKKVNTLTFSSQEIDSLSKSYSQKNSKRKFNEAFDDEFDMRNDTFVHSSSFSEQNVKKPQKKQKAKGIVNEAFNAESGTQDDSFDRSCVPQKIVKKRQKKQKVKGIVNEAFNAESSTRDDSFDHTCVPQKIGKKHQKKQKVKGIVNKAFNAESSTQNDSFDHSCVPEKNFKKPQKKQKVKGIVNEAFNAESSTQNDSFDHSCVPEKIGKKHQKKQKVKGIVNKAFNAESSTQDDSFGHTCVPQKIGKKHQKKQKVKGIVNEAFNAESSTRDDSFDHSCVPEKIVKKHQKKQKVQGIVNKAFNAESNSQPQVEQVNTPPWHVLDNVQSSNHLSGKVQSGATLRERMIAKLKASRFRYLNEQIYSSGSSDIHRYFSNDKNAFLAYHEGYRHQVSQWPLNPLDRIISALRKKPETTVIADFGCGEARLARSLPNTVHSFDVVALSEDVTACDMAHTPLRSESVDVAVFCLSLMGTNLTDYLLEANRILKLGGQLKIAEVESRFEDVNKFVHSLKQFGFTNMMKDLSHNVFYFLDFKKDRKPVKRKSLPAVTLKPCLYKKR